MPAGYVRISKKTTSVSGGECLRRKSLLYVCLLIGWLAVYAQAADMENMVVTAVQTNEPLTVDTDPKAPRQPLPAQDGADLLKTIPGFNVIRKGGVDGDPVFRGMAASRINILLDGEMLLGGCGMRMDPPTAYIFPETFDRLVVTKGPQTVLYGPGNSAATVRFERDDKRLSGNDVKLLGGLTAASYGRRDAMFNTIAGTPQGYIEVAGTYAEADDYQDGDGHAVHSSYKRWSRNLALGWTPDDDTGLELNGIKSDGEAAYADRTMDGVRFARDKLGLKFRKRNIGDTVQGIDAQLYYNYIDHVMDNYSLRSFTPTMTMPNPSASNPDRLTQGGRIQLDFGFSGIDSMKLGLDYQYNEHSIRSSMNQNMMPYEFMPRIDDAQFGNRGMFGEVAYYANVKNRIVAGLRFDDWQAEDKRATIRSGMMDRPNPTAGQLRKEQLSSGFARLEHYFTRSSHYVIGIGYVERFPDYWELIGGNKGSEAGVSAFNILTENTAQLDAGLAYRDERLSINVSLFYNRVDDYILIQSVVPAGMGVTTLARNIDATSRGGEFGFVYSFRQHWKVEGTAAYTRGDNKTDNLPLAQQPPLETRIGLNYGDGAWSAGALWRWVDKQNRYALNQGNIVGQDLGASDSFNVFSIHGGWTSGERLRLTAGIDNLLDKIYAEHISRSGAMVSGFVQTGRVSEPGRTSWLKAGISF